MADDGALDEDDECGCSAESGGQDQRAAAASRDGLGELGAEPRRTGPWRWYVVPYLA
ncbi:hypothetical protein ACFC8N_41125 [Streptomyces sp. NPDC055966]|uniref:hypothetical protein n=1 Tax=unclassified Streptomyces TaxID=2593676 RepID=UPI0035E2B020